MNTKHVLLDIAKSDLVAAKSLFKKKLYPQAVFYLEQSVEKATKSFGLHLQQAQEDVKKFFGLDLNVIGEKELKNIGHNSWEIYFNIAKGFKNNFPGLFKNFPKFDEDMDKSRSYLKQYGYKIPDEGVEGIISILNNLETEIKRIKINKNEMEQSKNETGRNLQEGVNTLIEEEPELIESIISLVICFIRLLFLSMLLCPHTTSSRYPYPKYKHNPLRLYTDKHPIIKRFDNLTQKTDEVLEVMSELFSENDSEN